MQDFLQILIYIAQALGGILIIAFLYAATMLGYFVWRRRSNSPKYLVEIVIVGSAIALSVIVRTITYMIGEQFTSGILGVYNGIYAAIGGLTFEGIELAPTSGVLLNCIFVGSSIYVGLIALSIITAKASYEIFSYILIYVFKGVKNNNTDIYIFTCVNEDILILANSIVEEHLTGSKKGRKYRIIFTGSHLESFEHKNPLHREIMRRGFLYYSYATSNNVSRRKSIINKLKYNTGNVECLYDFKTEASTPVNALLEKETQFILQQKQANKQKINNNNIHIFAFDLNYDLRGNESINTNIVFDEVDLLLEEMYGIKQKYTYCIVDLYLLANNEINYQYYERELEDRIIKKFKALTPTELTNEDFKFIKMHFQLHVINEAVVSAKTMVNHWMKNYTEESNKPNKENYFPVMVIGFGQTGQQAMDHLFVHTTYINEKDQVSQFVADVYDKDANNISGIYALANPFVSCIECKQELTPIIQQQKADNDEEQKFIAWAYNKEIEDAKKIHKQLGQPIIGFHEVSCFENQFVKFLDQNFGIELNKLSYKVIIIALGDDEANIKIANALIDDIRYELNIMAADKREAVNQTILIHLREGKNNNRINWNHLSAERYSSLKVIIFGNKEDIYSYRYIINCQEDMQYNYFYSQIYDLANLFDEDKNKIFAPDPKGDDLQGKQTLEAIIKRLDKGESKNKVKNEWLKKGVFEKESNNSVSLFSPVYYTHLLKIKNGLSFQNLRRLSLLEHYRWIRFYMIHGWKYCPTTTDKSFRRSIKEHANLCPVSMLTNNDLFKDFINIVVVYNQNKEK